jgi:hypothetical protein
MQKCGTLGQRLLGEKFVTQKEERKKMKNNPKNSGHLCSSAIPRGNASTSKHHEEMVLLHGFNTENDKLALLRPQRPPWPKTKQYLQGQHKPQLSWTKSSISTVCQSILS